MPPRGRIQGPGFGQQGPPNQFGNPRRQSTGTTPQRQINWIKPAMRSNTPQQPPEKKGGFISKLLGKSTKKQSPGKLFAPPSGSRQATRGSSAAAASGGIIESLRNPGTISAMLTNTQKVLNAAQQVTPMVQQYGPLVKNFPSMWKIYQGMKSIGSTDKREESISEESITVKPIKKAKASTSKKVPRKKEQTAKKATMTGTKPKGISGPKLYI